MSAAPSRTDQERAERLRAAYAAIREELAKFIVGQEEVADTPV